MYKMNNFFFFTISNYYYIMIYYDIVKGRSEIIQIIAYHDDFQHLNFIF
jgi:hypothetical protein